jgi:hypothetical protein
MVTLGLGVMEAGIYGVAGSVTWFWDHSFRILIHDTSRTTHHVNVDTLYHSDDLTISFSEIAHGREGCAKGEDIFGMRSLRWPAISSCGDVTSSFCFFVFIHA